MANSDSLLGEGSSGASRAARGNYPQAKLKGGIRCFDAKSLHVLRRATLTPPEPFHPKAFRSTQLRLPETFGAIVPPDPKTLCREHPSRSGDPSARPLRRIRRPFVANTPPDPRTLRRGRSIRSEDPLSRTLLQIRGPFVADAPSDPKTLCRERSSRSEDPLLRALRRIRGPFVALAPPGPVTLRCAK
jgi:hypothetical protein